MANSADSDQLASVCNDRAYYGSAGQGLRTVSLFYINTTLLIDTSKNIALHAG